MNRRAVVAILPGIAGLLLGAARSSAAGRYRVAFLSPLGFAPGSSSGVMTAGITERLARNGYREGGTLEVIKVGAAGHSAGLPRLISDLAARQPDVLVTF